MNHCRQAVPEEDPATTRVLGDWLLPGRALQNRAAGFSVIAGLIWPFQSAFVAFALGGLLTGGDVSLELAGLGFIALGFVRVILGLNADAMGDAAGEFVVRKARAHVVTIVATRATDSPFGGTGSISALAGEKLDLLSPYVTRYAPARARVIVVPLVIFALALWQSWAVAVILLVSGRWSEWPQKMPAAGRWLKSTP